MKHFDYVSFLGTDTRGYAAQQDNGGSQFNDSFWAERGFVCRIQKGGSIWEYSFNELPQDGASQLAREIQEQWSSEEELLRGLPSKEYPPLADDPWVEQWNAEVEQYSMDCSKEELFARLGKLQKRLCDEIPMVQYGFVKFQTVEVQKIFISKNKDLSQSFLWSESYLMVNLRKGDLSRMHFMSFSGLKGLDLLDEMDQALGSIANIVEPLMNAQAPEPGEYQVVLSPDVTGVLAHEAFGHGVESDTFVKGRALAPSFMGKAVASEVVDMHDSPKTHDQNGSYLFDDEGNRPGDQKIIDRGILKGAIGDQLSLTLLGQDITGNGRRESYKRKAYARMSNTWIAGGDHSVDAMIESVKQGYLIEKYSCGMEDPKNWGLQIAAPYGREIKDGKLTGKMVAPLYMTGFVPEILKNITMVSPQVELSGSGACGKGYKEYMKVSSGGPYIKTKMRLS